MSINLNAFFDMTYGLYIIGCSSDGKQNALLANSAVQVTAEPVKMAVSINNESLTCEYIKRSGIFCVQPIKEGADMVFIGNFGFRTGKNYDKFAKIKYKMTQQNVPVVLENALSYFIVNVEERRDLGTHTMFIGRVSECDILDGTGKPLTYSYYQTVMRGKTPRGATTFKE